MKKGPTLAEFVDTVLAHAKQSDDNFRVVQEALIEFKRHIEILYREVERLSQP